MSLENVKICLNHFAKDKQLVVESVPCIQHTVIFTMETPLKLSHSKLEFKNRVMGMIEHLFNDSFYLYDLRVEGMKTVVVTVVEIKDKIDIETGKENLK